MEIISQARLLLAAILHKAQNLFKHLPSLCMICHDYHHATSILCDYCIKLLTPITNPCYKCGHPLTTSDYKICGYCIKSSPFFDDAITPYYFIEPLRSIMHTFKYHDGLFLANFLSSLLLDSINLEDLPECLIPVPIHYKRIRVRGYNQSAILTKILSRRLGIPYALNLCKKIRNTKPQTHLDRNERQINLDKSFYSPPLPYKDVAIVDDIFTTGSTTNELAKILKDQGVKRVRIWCISRTPR